MRPYTEALRVNDPYSWHAKLAFKTLAWIIRLGSDGVATEEAVATGARL